MRKSGWVLTGACALVLGCGLAVGGATPAHAASAAAASAERETVVRGLEAQYAAVLIKERKLADDRETRLLGAAEARLTKARAELSAVKRESAAELGAARADYARLATEIVQRDAAAHAEIEAYRAEAEQRVAQATPEELAALQQFADGDRTVAEPVLMAIRDARKRATLAAAKIRIAQDERATADEHDVMREHGETTTLEVLNLYETAAEDDPDDWKTNLLIGRLSQQEHDYGRSSAALVRAVAAARTDRERETAYRYLGFTQQRQGKLAEADKSLRLALDLSLKLAAAEPKSVAALRELAFCYIDYGTSRREQGDTAGAMASYKSALDAAGGPDAPSTALMSARAQANERIGDLQSTTGDAKAALASYQAEVDLTRRMAAVDPKSSTPRYYQGRALRRIGDEYQVLGDQKSALASYDASNRLFRELAQQDPTSVSYRQEVAIGLERSAIVQAKGHDLVGARRSFQEALAVFEALAAQHPDSPELLTMVATEHLNIADTELDQGDKAAASVELRKGLDMGRDLVTKDPLRAQAVVGEALDGLAQIPGSGVSWAEVVAQYQGMRDRGQLDVAMDGKFDEAKRHAAEEAKAKQGDTK
jgi:tetratricopeptide (TPR) repeat protein